MSVAYERNHRLAWVLIVLAGAGLIYLLRGMLLPFVVGLLVAYFLDPVVDRLERWKWSRNSATLLVLGVFFVSGGAVIAWLSPVLWAQLMAFLQAAPEMVIKLRVLAEGEAARWLARLGPEAGEQVSAQFKETLAGNAGNIAGMAKGLVQGVLKGGVAVVGVLSLLLITPLVAYYCLRDWDKMVAYVDGLLPRSQVEVIRTQAREVDRVIAGFVRGQMIVCMMLATYYSVALSLLGLDYALLIGLVSGLLAFVPYIGVMVGMISAVAVAYAQFGDWQMILFALGVFGVGQFIEGNFIAPKIIGDRVGLHPAWIIFGLLAGGTLLGMVGVLIAVPLSAVAGVGVRFLLERYRESELYAPKKRKVTGKAGA